MYTDKDSRGVFIGQNSIIFSLLEFLAISPILGSSLVVQNNNDAPMLILHDFWIDNVHASRLDTEWGQTILEFPLFFRQMIIQIINEQKKTLNLEERITFAVYKSLREKIIEYLKKNGVKIVRGQIVATEKINENYIKFTINQNNKIKKIIITSQEKIFNTLMKPRSLQRRGEREIFPPQTDLYKYAKGEEPTEIIIIGSGLSAVWIKEQCPNSTIRYIFRNRNSAPPSIKRNINIEILQNEVFYNEDIELLPTKVIYVMDDDADVKKLARTYFTSLNDKRKLKEHEFLSKKNIDIIPDNHGIIYNKALNEIKFCGLVYNATGFEPDLKDIPNAINVHFQQNVKKPFAPKNLPLGALIDRYTDQEVKFSEVLSINKRYLLIPIEILFFRREHLNWFADYMKSEGITLLENFFVNLESLVILLEDTPKKPLIIINQAFEKITEDLTLRQKFSISLDKMYREREKLIYNDKLESNDKLEKNVSIDKYKQHGLLKPSPRFSENKTDLEIFIRERKISWVQENSTKQIKFDKYKSARDFAKVLYENGISDNNQKPKSPKTIYAEGLKETHIISLSEEECKRIHPTIRDELAKSHSK